MKIKITSTGHSDVQKHYPILKKYKIDEDDCIELSNLEELVLLQRDLENIDLITSLPYDNRLPYQLEIEIYDDWRE